ncbi:dicarboxylate/amino acid:cation symporter [Aliidiomarina halalkaliphila]|uniref:Dicarboxylate/amino acid:cation symporter n=1 Tax=Aliidiomarina halalkaliphila TaxID=2593535 RepID=A0A552X2W6_9GAMM|nr:dicarboxylate/amino acid:cation symporter [Aliidiomarina halalkaliphila]TRW49382.1 dicarboxylate/amino acid:cation symporter [Aliidiomarina halalkaliphila]
MLQAWFRIPFWQRVLGAFILGGLLGVVAADVAIAMQPLGQLFIRAIQMLVAPLILFAIVSSITSMQSHQRLGRLASKTVGLFLLTAFIASAIGLTVATLLDLAPVVELTAGEVRDRDIPPVSQVLLSVIPTNPFAALVEGNVLQIITFSVVLALALNALQEKAAPVRDFFQSGAEVMYQITRYVLELTPIGVFGLMAWVVGTHGLDMLLPLAKFVGAIYLACIIHIVFVYGSLVRFGAKVSPWRFFRAILPTQIIAYSTSSSFGTLPSTLKTTTEKLGVKKEYASFSLPLGATINMDGCGGIYPAIAAIFIAHLYGIPLGFTEYAIIMVTATLASIGTAGVPGSAMVMLTVTLSAVGLPLEGIAFIAAIDRIIDMMRTATNVTGDMTVSLVVAKSEDMVDESVLAAGLRGDDPVDSGMEPVSKTSNV